MRILYFTLEAFTQVIGIETMLELLDRGRTGQVDRAAFESLAVRACNHVDAKLAGRYREFVPFVGVVPPEIESISISVARAMLACDHPDYLKYDYAQLMRWCDSQLTDMRIGRADIGQRPPDPSQVSGGAVFPTPEPPAVNVPRFTKSWGVF